MADKRYSILTNNLENCYVCGQRKDHLHEVFYGPYRQTSIKWGLVLPLCYWCHQGDKGVHNKGYELNRRLKRMTYEKAIEVYGWTDGEWREKFMKVPEEVTK